MSIKLSYFLPLLVLLIAAPFLFNRLRSHPTAPTSAIPSVTSPTPSSLTSTPAPLPTPTPHPPTLQELNSRFGPCVHLPVLMFHHIQPEAQAKVNKQTGLTVDTTDFAKDLEYLKQKNYTVIPPQSLINFFDNGTPLPAKPVMLTFDDAYRDFYTDAYPLLSQHHFFATLFVPTGLVENPDYVSWDNLKSMANSGLLLAANHTWSHHGMKTQASTVDKEITLADTQLSNHDLNSPKVFAFPYGTVGPYAISFLESHGYRLAFTTQHGFYQCKQQRLTLPRIRIGNAPLSSYGL